MESPRAITKILLPGKRSHLLHRPRLTDFLHEYIERKLLLVSASAGYGKTSLLIDFARETTLPVCWYSLDASDGDPKTFLECVIASLRRQFPDFGSRTLGLLSDTALLRDPEVIVGTLVTEIHEDIPRYFVLILDDYHTVESSDVVNHILDTLLRLLPENAHIILASRTLPTRLTLTRLAARQEIGGLGTNDLRFTSDEIRALVRQNYHVELSEHQAFQLAEQSEGWITGILLTTHSLWQGLFQDLVRWQGPQSNIYNYLASEVFAQQPPDLQRFLLESSILDQLNPTLCDELLGTQNSTEMLRTIEQRNLFVTRLEEAGAWYRYHHLFQEFLQARLRESDSACYYDLHLRAATLFEARRAWDQVIAHYLKAESFDDAARVIERVAKETFDSGRWTTLAKWIDALPQEVLDAHPHVIVWRARILGDTGASDRALELFSQVLGIFERLGDSTGTGITLVKQATYWRFRGRYQEAIENCQRALTLLGDDAKVEIAEAHRTLGISYGQLGNLAKDIEELESALIILESLGDLTGIALLHQDLGVACRTAGSADAQRHFQQALDYWRRANNPLGLANTLNSIGISYHRQGNYSKAIETLEEARAEARRSGQLRIEAFALASLGDVYRDQGEYARAQEAYQTAFDIAQRINEGFVITYTLGALGELFRLTGDFDTADQLLQQALEQAENHRSNYEVGLTETALGILACEQGNAKVGVDHLTHAVELLEQGGAKRDSARAHLHLAHAHFLQRKYRQVSHHLKETANIGKFLREDQFIVAGGKHLLPLIKYAVSRKIGNGYFTNVLKTLKTLPVASAETRAMEISEPKVPRIEAHAFGTATVTIDGKPVTKSDWDAAVTKELFFFLLAHPEGLRKEEILDALWRETSPAKASGVFHSAAWRMRRALFSKCLVYDNGLYRLGDKMDLWYDVAQFNQLISQAKNARTEKERADSYRDAIALYRGPYFEDSYSDWCIPLRTALQQQYLDALYSLAVLCDQANESEEAVALYQRILENDSYREDVYQALMRLQIRSGDRAGALKTYYRCAQVLQEEMHLEPSPETRALYEQIVKGIGT